MTDLDRTWHLAQTEEELKMTEFELLLWRVFYGFLRWQEDCEDAANNTSLTGNELAVLHIIRMKDRPKTIYEIGRLLNRDDTFNIQYSIRKLDKMGLIKRAKLDNKKVNAYEITPEGIKNTDQYTEARRKILIDMFVKDLDLDFEKVSKSLANLKGIYDEAARVATSYKK